MRDCITMCFDICTINIRVSIRVRGLHLVFVFCFISIDLPGVPASQRLARQPGRMFLADIPNCGNPISGNPHMVLFPECVARVPVSLWGSGVEGVFARRCRTVRNRSQPSVRTPYGRAYGKFCRGGHFWGFQTCRCFVSRGRRGTL